MPTAWLPDEKRHIEVPFDAQIAAAYGVSRSTFHEWRKRGLEIESPAKVLDSLARQKKPGSAFARLSDPATMAEVTAAIAKLKERYEQL